jgi:RNA polymerase sigma factor (sigma-70 family)
MASPESTLHTAAVRRPNIALEMVRTRAACERAVVLSKRSFSLRAALDAVTHELDRVAPTVVDQYRAPDCVDVVAPALAELVASTTTTSRAALRREMRDAYESEKLVNATTINAIVESFTLDGLDGDALSWSIILLETTHHTKLIWLQANRIARAATNVNPSDLLGWGWQGLRMALRNYDPTSFAFSTYACTRINGAIRDGIRREGPVPKRLTTYVRKVTAAEELLSQRLGRTPTLAELAEHLDSTLSQLTLAARCAPVASLDARLEFTGTEDPSWSDYAVTDPAALCVDSAWADAFAEAFARLAPDEAEAVQLLIVDERPLAEARVLSGATARQLRQRAQRGKAHLAELLAPWNHLVAVD